MPFELRNGWHTRERELTQLVPGFLSRGRQRMTFISSSKARYSLQHLVHVLAVGICHSRRRSNVFRDASFWFCPNLDHFCPNFAQISLKFAKCCPNFAQKIFFGNAGAFPAPTPLHIVRLELQNGHPQWPQKHAI